jgi:glycosyltransferase involved in cell wall biosynthesis
MLLNPTRDPIRILAVIEANTVTGPAKNLLEFATLAREPARRLQDSPAMEVSLATFERRDRSERGPRTNRFVQAARDAGIDVAVITERFRFDTQVLPGLAGLIRDQKPHLVQTHGVKSHFLMRLLRRWRSIPWVAFHHGYTTPDLKMRAYNRLDRWSLPYASRVVTMNLGFTAELTRNGVDQNRIRIVHNAIASSWVDHFTDNESRGWMRAEIRGRLGIASDEFLVLCVGRLSREKGHSDLIEAFDLLRGGNPAVKPRLVLVGDGPERRKLERSAFARGLQEQVTFTGQVDDVAPLYAAADLFVLPSHSEGSPNALLEAMGAGLPVVATRLSGVGEIARDRQNALLVPPRAAWHLAAAMHDILGSSELSSGLAATAGRTVRELFTHEARFRSLTTLYSELVSADANRTALVA